MVSRMLTVEAGYHDLGVEVPRNLTFMVSFLGRDNTFYSYWSKLAVQYEISLLIYTYNNKYVVMSSNPNFTIAIDNKGH